MSKRQDKQPHYAMTLRLDPSLEKELESVACDLNLSRTDFIRRSLGRALAHAKEHELPLLTEQVREALRPRVAPKQTERKQQC